MKQHFSMSSFVAGIMLGALLVGAWFSDGVVGLMPPASSSLLDTTAINLPNQNGVISVADQPSGERVIVESVVVPPLAIWVAVREMSGRDLGNVLGATRMIGPRDNVTISLLRATEPNRPYAVQLYRDDGNGAFDPSVNSVYVDFDTGARVVAYFTTTE